MANKKIPYNSLTWQEGVVGDEVPFIILISQVAKQSMGDMPLSEAVG